MQSERRRSARRDRAFSRVHAGLRSSDRRLWLALLGIVIAAAAVIIVMIKFEFRSHDGPLREMVTPARIVLACGASNLPAAAALLPAGTPGLWAAILATTVGPNLLITGSVATLITRRIARDGGATLSAWQLSVVGLALVPAQLAAATLGLHILGVLR
jgi:hypothetical protein